MDYYLGTQGKNTSYTNSFEKATVPKNNFD